MMNAYLQQISVPAQPSAYAPKLVDASIWPSRDSTYSPSGWTVPSLSMASPQNPLDHAILSAASPSSDMTLDQIIPTSLAPMLDAATDLKPPNAVLLVNESSWAASKQNDSIIVVDFAMAVPLTPYSEAVTNATMMLARQTSLDDTTLRIVILLTGEHVYAFPSY